jgi:hypothetical protein
MDKRETETSRHDKKERQYNIIRTSSMVVAVTITITITVTAQPRLLLCLAQEQQQVLHLAPHVPLADAEGGVEPDLERKGLVSGGMCGNE